MSWAKKRVQTNAIPTNQPQQNLVQMYNPNQHSNQEVSLRMYTFKILISICTCRLIGNNKMSLGLINNLRHMVIHHNLNSSNNNRFNKIIGNLTRNKLAKITLQIHNNNINNYQINNPHNLPKIRATTIILPLK